MALKKQTISFPILKGSDEKSSLPYSEPGSIEDADQVVFNKTGEVVKRKGFDNFRNVSDTVGDQSSPFGGIAVSTTYTKKGVRLHKFKDSLLMADGQMLYNKVGASNMKPIEFLLDGTYSNRSVYTPSNKKVGRVNVIRKTMSSIDYDIFSWVQTEPSLPASGATFEIMMAVQEVESKSFYRAPTVIDSITRVGSNFYEDVCALPSLHMVEDNASKIYLVYTSQPSIGGLANVKARQFSFSGTVPPTLTSGGTLSTLRDTGSTDVKIHKRATSIAVDVNTSADSLYVFGYNNTGTNVTGDITVYQFDFSTFASNWDALNQAVANSASTQIETDCIGFGSGNFLGVTLRYSDPEDSLTSAGEYPLMVAFTRKYGSGKADELEVVYRFYQANLGASASVSELTDTGLRYKYLINGTQSYVADNSADIFLTVGEQLQYTTGTTTVTQEGGGGASFEYPSSPVTNLYGIKSVTVTNHNMSEKEGLIKIIPSQYANMEAEYGSACVVYAQHKDIGSSGPVNVTVIEPGSGFTAADTANFKAAFDDFFSHTFGSGDFTLTFDEDNELIRAKNHEVRYISLSNRGVAGTSAVISSNASLISDSFRDYVSTSLKADATGVGLKTYVNISRTNGNTGSFNSFNSLIDTKGRLLSCTPTGTSSLNYSSDYESAYRNHLRMFDGVSRVQRISPSGYGKIATNFLFGSNVLTADGNTYTDSEDSSLASQTGSDQFYSVGITELDPLPARSLPAVDVGNQLLIGGGVLCAYDGNTLVENGFYEYPEIRSLEPIATNFGSNLVASKTYTYSFVYEYIDSLNNIHESVTTPQQQVDTTATKTAICARVYACDVSLKRGAIRVTMYRSTPSGDGVLLKKVKTAILDETQRHFTFFDFGEVQDVFDAAPVIYTTGGVLDNYQPGSITDAIEHKGRVFLATPTEFVRYSKPLQQGFAAGFPVPQFVIDVPGDASEITGIESNPNFLCLFTRDSVFAVSGDGPNAIGQGGFSQPTLLGHGQGAVPGTAHLSHSFGTFYMADRGIYLVTPNGQIQYVGAPVENTVLDKGIVKSIDVFDHNNEIRFLIQPSNSSTRSTICCFNTFYKQWSVWDLGEHIVDQINYSATGGSGDDTHYILSDHSPIRRQSTTSYTDTNTDLDDGSPSTYAYNMRIDFMPISINGIQGAQRVYRAMLLYTDKDAGDVSLQISLAFDYNGFTENHYLATMPDAPNNLRIHLSQQKCKAVQVRLTVTGNNSGITLNGLALEIGARPGTFKLPAAQTIAPV